MSVYVVIESRVRDPEKYGQYVSQVPGIVAKHGGRYLVRGGKVTALLEGRWTPERMIVLEFPSEASVRAWLASPEYQAIAPPSRGRSGDPRGSAGRIRRKRALRFFMWAN